MGRLAVFSAAVLLLCVLAQAKFTDKEKLQRGYFEGRSGDIVLNIEQHDDAFISISSDSEFKSKNIQDVRVGDLLAHVTGSLPLNQDIDRSDFPKTSLFSEPKSLLLFTFPGLSKGDVEKLVPKQRLVKIDSSSAPYDPVAELTTLLSGAVPREHGIVQRQWRGASASGSGTAYRHEAALPTRGGLASVWSRSQAGRAVVLAASSDAQLAAALGAHPALLQAEPRWPHALLLWDGAAQLLSSPAGPARHVIASHQQLPPSAGPAAAALLAELQQLAELPAFFGAEQTAALLHDATPDYVAVALASLAGVKAALGADSKHWPRVLDLVAAALAQLRAALPADRTVLATLLLPAAAPAPLLPAAQLARAEQLGAQLYVQDQDPAQLSALCAELPSALCASRDLEYSFAASQQEQRRELRQGSTNDTTTPPVTDTPPPDAPDISGEDIAELQICLWFGIVIVLVALGGVWGLCGASGTPDTLLYRPTHQRMPGGH